jgi:hypothetical protein
MKKWIVGVALVILSPLIVTGAIAWAFVYKLPLTAYELAEEIWKLK